MIVCTVHNLACIALAIKENNIHVWVATIYFGATQLAHYCKLINYIIKQDLVLKLEQIAENDIFNRYSESQEKRAFKTVEFTLKLGSIYRLSVFFSGISLLLQPFREGGKTLPFAALYPLSLEDHYWYLYSFQVIYLVVMVAVNLSFDTFTWAITQIGTIQCDVLIENLENLKKDAREQITLKNKIIECVKHQEMIIELISTLKDLISNGMLGQFILSISVICVTGFQILLVSVFSFEFWMFSLYLMLSLTQIGMYCWFGHNILSKSIQIGDACYMSEWYTFSVEEQKMFLLIMKRAVRPLVLSGGKFFVLSLPSFGMVMYCKLFSQ